MLLPVGDPGSKPGQIYARRRDRQNYIRKNKVQLGLGGKGFRFVRNILVQCVGPDCKVSGITFMTVFIMRWDGACFSYGYNRIVAVTPCEQHILCNFRYKSDSCICLIRVGAVKLAQAGFGDTFSWQLCQEDGREVVNIIQRCILLMQFLTVPDTILLWIFKFITK